MTAGVLVRPLSSVAWELRTAWASGRRVALSLERCDVARIEGVVTRVAATDASVLVGGTLVPLDRVLAVHWPSLLGDAKRIGRGVGGAVERPGQLAWHQGTYAW